jgi:hypothetical protein
MTMKFLIATMLAAALITNPAKAADLDSVIGGAAALTLYVGHCGGTLPRVTKQMVEAVILEVPAKVMVRALAYDEKRKMVGNDAFCTLVRKNFADVL